MVVAEEVSVAAADRGQHVMYTLLAGLVCNARRATLIPLFVTASSGTCLGREGLLQEGVGSGKREWARARGGASPWGGERNRRESGRVATAEGGGGGKS